MFKCWWQPLVAAGTRVSALILPQHASDRQMIEKEPERRRRGAGAASGVCVWDSTGFESRTRAPISNRSAVRYERLAVFFWTISLSCLLLHILFSSSWLSYSPAASVTGIPLRFQGNEVRGGHSLLAVVCNHHRLCCVFLCLPPPPLLTSPTLFREAERDPQGPRVSTALTLRSWVFTEWWCLCVCVCVTNLEKNAEEKTNKSLIWLRTSPPHTHTTTTTSLSSSHILYLLSPVCPLCQFVVGWCFTTAFTAVDQSECVFVCLNDCFVPVYIHVCMCVYRIQYFLQQSLFIDSAVTDRVIDSFLRPLTINLITSTPPPHNSRRKVKKIWNGDNK